MQGARRPGARHRPRPQHATLARPRRCRRSADKQCSPGPGSEALACGTFNPAPSTYSMGAGAAVVVQPGLFDAAGDVLRVQPSVAYDPNRNLICVFNG